jgi:hypothetical protein
MCEGIALVFEDSLSREFLANNQLDALQPAEIRGGTHGAAGTGPVLGLLCGPQNHFADEALRRLPDNCFHCQRHVLGLQHLARVFLGVR